MDKLKRKYTIHIIDDSPEDRSIIKSYLSDEQVELSNVAFEVTEADSLNGELQKMGDVMPDCFLLDYSLSNTDGIQALKMLKKHYGTSLCAIFLTSSGNEDLVVHAFKNGAYDYLQKGKFDALGLQFAIQRAIKKERIKKQLQQEKEELRQKNLELEEAKKALEERQRELIRMQLEQSIAMVDIQKENERKTRELEEARQLQLSMLPFRPPKLDYLEMDMRMHTCAEVGGDYYDYKLGQDNSLMAVVGDATGHGVRAGIVVATVKSYFHAVDAGNTPLELLEDVSEGIQNLQVRNMYMGLCAMHFRPGQAQIAAAGMPPLYVYRKQQQAIEEVKLIGPFLGSSLRVKIQEVNIPLAEGDLLFAFSDGLPELFNEGKEQLGFDRILETLKTNAAKPLSEILDAFDELSVTWRASSPICDDIAMLLVRMK